MPLDPKQEKYCPSSLVAPSSQALHKGPAKGKGKSKQGGVKNQQSRKQAGSQQQNPWQKQVFFKDLTLEAVESDDECTNTISSYKLLGGHTGATAVGKSANTMIDQIAQNFVASKQAKDKKLSSPTFTDSTDEPTPMSFFKQGKGFRFHTGENDNEGQDGIGFDEQ